MESMQRVMGRILLFTLAGLIAGLLTWLVSDVSGLVHIGDNVGQLSTNEARGYWIVFASWGGFVGVLLSVADAFFSGSQPQWWKIIAVGAVVGILSGMFGGALGMGAFAMLYVFPANTPFDFLRNVLGRAAGFAFIGGLAGTAPGWRKWSLPVGRNGLIGGFLGGIIGGSTFEIIPYLVPGVGVGIISRLFAFVITGAMIGLFVALVQHLLKEAWIRVVVGRNEGKEVLIEKQETSIGRYELSDITLFGDPKVARTHAILVAQPGGRFLLQDTGESSLGLLVNGQQINKEIVVKNGDQIQIASKLLVFYERFTKTPTVVASRDVAEPRPSSISFGPSLADLPIPGTVAMPDPVAVRGSGGIVNPARLALVAVSGSQVGTRFVVDSGAVAGRDPVADVPMTSDTRASRHHARFLQEGTGWIVEDAGSTNGTFVNGQRISRQELTRGDVVVIGTTQFRVEQ